MPEPAPAQIQILAWNLFHGRDHAPAGLDSPRARITRETVRGADLSQTNTDLYRQFAQAISRRDWDVAMLQEVPPRWWSSLARDCDSEVHGVLTARNLPAPLDRLQWCAARLNPDLIASWEGGSNLTLVRRGSSLGGIVRRGSLRLRIWPERRAMAWTETASGISFANLHASEAPERSAEEILRAARRALEWADGGLLVFGGDLNLRPERSPETYERLAALGLCGDPIPGSVDQVLVRRPLGSASEPTSHPGVVAQYIAEGALSDDARTGVTVERLPDDSREVEDPTAPDDNADHPPIRLSDHRQLVVRLAVSQGT